jgi:hypothetical protein
MAVCLLGCAKRFRLTRPSIMRHHLAAPAVHGDSDFLHSLLDGLPAGSGGNRQPWYIMYSSVLFVLMISV